MHISPTTTLIISILSLSALAAAHPEPSNPEYDIYAREAFPEPEPYFDEPLYARSEYDIYAREAFPDPEPEPEPEAYFEEPLYARSPYPGIRIDPFPKTVHGTCQPRGWKNKLICLASDGMTVIAGNSCSRAGQACDSKNR